mgnify:CR=1 FL=1
MEDNPHVNIYIETSVHGPAQHGGRYIYLLECLGADGTPRTRYATGEWQNEKENSLALQAMAAALERLKGSCVVDVYTTCRLIKNAIENGWLEDWKTNGWKNGKGIQIKNRDLWERIAAKAEEHLVFVYVQPHSYREWMQMQMKGEENGKKNCG